MRFDKGHIESAQDAARREPTDRVCLAWLTDAELPSWDAWVDRHPLAVVYHCSPWMRVLESAFPHMKGEVLVLRNAGSGEILGGLPICQVRSWILGTRRVSIPYASIGDPLVSNAGDLNRLLSGLTAKHGANGVEVRTWRTPASYFTDAPVVDRALHHVVDLAPGPEDIYRRLSRTAVRRMISKGTKAGIQVVEARGSSEWTEFHRLLTASRRALGLPAMPLTFFEAIRQCLPESRRLLLLAIKDGRPIGGALGLKSSGVFILEYSGEETLGSGSGAGQMVYWESLRRACIEGCRWFSFGRTSIDNSGLAAYKRHWATVEEELLSFGPGMTQTSRKAVAGSSKTRRLIGAVSRYAPHPVYRLLSNFCYRHWG